MRAGLLNYPITIQEPITLKDVYGANGIDWKDAISTRAQITYNSGNRQNQNNEIIHCYTVTFTIRLYHKVNVWGTERSVYESVGWKMGERFVFQRVRRVWLK